MIENKRTDRIRAVADKVLSKVEKRFEGDDKISAELLGLMSDIVKDMSSVEKNLEKADFFAHKDKEDEIGEL